MAIQIPLSKPRHKALGKGPHTFRATLPQLRPRKKRIRYPNKVVLLPLFWKWPDRKNAEVSEILQSALLQSISTTLSKLPSSAFPITPSIFYETYILPYRPSKELAVTDTPVDIKHSGYKSLTAFLKANAKEGLIKLKESKGEVVVTGAYRIHKVSFISRSDHI